MLNCSNAQMLKCSNAQTLKCSNAQEFKCSNTQMLKCSSAQMLKCSNAQMLNTNRGAVRLPPLASIRCDKSIACLSALRGGRAATKSSTAFWTSSSLNSNGGRRLYVSLDGKRNEHHQKAKNVVNAQMLKCTNVTQMLLKCSNVQMLLKCSNARMHKCTNVTQMLKCSNAQMHT